MSGRDSMWELTEKIAAEKARNRERANAANRKLRAVPSRHPKAPPTPPPEARKTPGKGITEVDNHQAPVVDKVVDSPPQPEPTPRVSNLSTAEMVDNHQTLKVDSRKGDRHGKSKAQYNNWIDGELLQEIKEFCTKHRMKRQEFAELSAVLYMRTVDNHQASKVDSLLAHDDRRKMIAWNTREPIINLYLEYNPKNKWTAKDDRLASAYNDTDLRLIEMGIIDTQLNANLKRIHTFDYYRGQIDLWVEQAPPAESLDMLLAVARRRLRKAKEGK